MGELRHKYERLEQLPPNAIPVSEYADRTGTHRSYIHVKYNRFWKGFKKNGTLYYGADPGYRIVTYHKTCYVIDNDSN
jgi:hypothetical protein